MYVNVIVYVYTFSFNFPPDVLANKYAFNASHIKMQFA